MEKLLLNKKFIYKKRGLEEGFIAEPEAINSKIKDKTTSGEKENAPSVNYEEMDLDLERILSPKKSDKNTENKPIPQKQPDNRNIIKLQPEGQEKNQNEKDISKKDDQTKNIQNKAIREKPNIEKKKGAFDEITLQDKKIIEEKISNNSSAIKDIEEKLDSISEDVDDLVSLYEIVSVEMNPFVGLSKITRKRLDALENMDKEFTELKTRIEDLERNPRPVAGTPTSPVSSKPADVFGENNVFHNEIDKIIDDAIKYIVNEKEIDEIIAKFIEDLEINKTIAK
jgi:flagellar protein FlaC